MEKTFTSLDRERKAVDEIKEKLINHWDNDKKTFVKLSQENKLFKVNEYVIEGTKSIIELFHHIIVLWKYDPIIYRVMFHNLIPSEDIKARSLFREKYLPDEYLEYYKKQFQFESVLEDSELAKAQKVKSWPIHSFMVGKMLGTFLTDYQHFRMIDKVKEAGEKSTIEELREKRFSIDGETEIYDYSPLYKDTIIKGCVTREFFNKDDFDKFKKENIQKTKDEIDDMLCFLIQKTMHDQHRIRLNNLFGNTQKTEPETFNIIILAKNKFTLKYKNEEKIIPLQLYPKWFGDVLKIAGKYDFNRFGYKKTGRDRSEEIQNASLGLYIGATKWDRKRPSTACLREHMSGQMGTAFKEVSIEIEGKKTTKEGRAIKKILEEHDKYDLRGTEFKTKKRKTVLKEDMDSFKGGSLDEYNAETGELKKKILDGHHVSPEDKVIAKNTLDDLQKTNPKQWGKIKRQLNKSHNKK